jgi:predicted metal-binding protein
VSPKKSYKKYLDLARVPPVHTAKIIDVDQVVVADWVRLKCQYGCGAYGTRYTCPPYSPTPEETRKVLSGYSKALFYIFDHHGTYAKHRNRRRNMHKFLSKLEREMFLDGFYRAFGMASGPCNLCRSCDVTEPCRHPREARPSMEACGIDVYATAKNAGFDLTVVRTFEDPCTFCHLILIE